MDVSAVIIKLQGLHAAITGITTAPTAMPGALNTADLPCVLVYPGEAKHEKAWDTGKREDRTFLVLVYVKPIGQGQGVDEGFQECLPFFERFSDVYQAKTNRIVDDRTWHEMVVEWDSGVRANLTLHGSPGGQAHWGIEWRLRIWKKVGNV